MLFYVKYSLIPILMLSTSQLDFAGTDQQVGLVILDEIHLLGADRGPILEVYSCELLWQCNLLPVVVWPPLACAASSKLKNHE